MAKRPEKRSEIQIDNPGLAEELGKLKGMRYYDQRMKLRELKQSGALGELDIDTPDWLIEGRTIESAEWVCWFGVKKKGIRIDVDFRIKLYDGSLLTDDANATLLKMIKVFLILQIHPRYNGGSRRGAETEAQIFRHGLHFVDWLLMQGERFGVVENGFSHISQSHLIEYLLLNTSNPISTHLYAYPTKLAAELKRVSCEVKINEVLDTSEEWGECCELIDPVDRTLDMSKDELIRARVWMFQNNYYTKQFGVLKYNSAHFIRSFYGNTLGGIRLTVRTFDELNGGEAWRTEYPSVPVRNEVTPTVSSKTIGRVLRAMKKLAVLNSFFSEARFDSNALSDITVKTILSKVCEKPEGRFRSLPGEVVFKLIREFYEYIKTNHYVVTSAVMSHAARDFDKSKRAFNVSGDARESLDYKIGSGFDDFSVWMIPYSNRTKNYFELFRKNYCLYDSYTVLMGAYISIIGLLTARRQIELLGLKATTCLQPNRSPYDLENRHVQYELIFDGGKTGNRHGKEIMHVPIPLMVAKLIWDLKTFHKMCNIYNLLPLDAPLFIHIRPDNLKFGPMDARTFNNCLSAICDYTQTPVVVLENGTHARFYVRQHQLRRFFAMAFFASAGFKGLDALRAFLGHSDLEHLYNYILEITPGSMLEGVKAECLTDALFKGDSTIRNLDAVAKLLAERLGCRDIGVKTFDEINHSIKRAADRGEVVADFDFSEFTYSEIYSDVIKLVNSHQIDLKPNFASITSEEGRSFEVKLTVTVHYA